MPRKSHGPIVGVAQRPPGRTVEVQLRPPFAGWRCVARADFRAGTLADLQSQDAALVIGALQSIIVSHNFPNDQGELAATMADVEPWDGMLAACSGIIDALARLPNR